MKNKVVLLSVENKRPVTKENSSSFLLMFQRAILLALKEDGQFSKTAYSHAEEMLLKQFPDASISAYLPIQ